MKDRSLVVIQILAGVNPQRRAVCSISSYSPEVGPSGSGSIVQGKSEVSFTEVQLL
jgi:hypothetical protein